MPESRGFVRVARRPARPALPGGAETPFLQSALAGGTVEITLMDGRVLRGRLVAADRYALLLEEGEETPASRLLFKHAVMSIRHEPAAQ